MKKEIIGYQLVKPEFERAAINIMKGQPDYFAINDWNIELRNKGYDKSLPVDCASTKWLQKAGVLKLWFKPIYRVEEVNLKEGDWLYIESIRDYEEHEGDVIRITRISPDIYEKGSKWIDHTPDSFSGGGFRWCDSAYQINRDFRIATPEEIGEYLVNEAIQKYPLGCKVDQRNAYGGSGSVLTVGKLPANYSKSGLKGEYINVSIGGVGVYNTKYNVWAKIIPNVPQIIINGYLAEFGDDEVSFGCQTLTFEMVEKLVNLADYEVTMVDSNGKSINEQVREIYFYLLEQKQ